MMTNHGIFETLPGASEPQAAPPFSPSPFAAAPEPASSPFTAVTESPPPPNAQPAVPSAPQKPSPFTAIDEAEERPTKPYHPAKIPKKRRQQSPFQIAEPSEGFGAMSTLQGIPVHPFVAPYVAQTSPFTPAVPSEFGAFSAPQASQAFSQPFAPHPFSQQHYAPQPAIPQPQFEPSSTPAQSPPAPAFALTSDSSSSRQLELCAIFGVDREMGVDEIIQRCRALPGIRNIACLGGQDAGTIESLKALLAKLGYGGSTLRIYAGQCPVEFIREGNILLAVQTDGGFAPGVRETLMIVAREMARLA